jgi:glycerate 2-kinase
MTATLSIVELTKLLPGFLREAILQLDVAARVRHALPRHPRDGDRVTLIAIGKAAPAMAAGALARWSSFIERGLVIAPDGSPCAIDDARIEILRAAHPIPDERSVIAGERVLDLAKNQRRSVILALISGGASSLVCVPSAGVTLEDKRKLASTLLLSGASIREVNTVRRHLSRIKGGGLALAAAPSRTTALLVSDVIDGGSHDIGSGPPVPDPTTVDDARALLLRHAPRQRALPLRETLKPGDPGAPLQRSRIIASPPDLAVVMAQELARAGWTTRVAKPSSADTSTLAEEYAKSAAALQPGEAIVRVAEPSVRILSTHAGRGGRSVHLASIVARSLPKDVVFFAAASDGVDGTSGAAGAIVDSTFIERVGASRYAEAIAEFDTATLHEIAGTSFPAAPSGINLTDIHVLARGA